MKRNREAEKRGRREEKGQTKRREKQAHIFQAPQAMAANARKRGWGGEKRNLFAKSCSHRPSALPPCTLPLALLQQLPHATPSPHCHCPATCDRFQLGCIHSSALLLSLYLSLSLSLGFFYSLFFHFSFPCLLLFSYIFSSASFLHSAMHTLPLFLLFLHISHYIFFPIFLYIFLLFCLILFISLSFYASLFPYFSRKPFFYLILTSAFLLFTLYRTSYYNQSLTGKSDLSLSLSIPLLPLQIHIYLLFLCSISLLFLRHLSFYLALLRCSFSPSLSTAASAALATKTTHGSFCIKRSHTADKLAEIAQMPLIAPHL